MSRYVNPFAELYLGETLAPNEFVNLFSPFLVGHALPLFQRGHVVLTGVQGSGKTMLLSLLRPSIRLAFQQAAAPFPVPEPYARFLAGGINLRHSSVMSFGQRGFSSDPEAATQTTPLFFADFLNHYLVRGLLQSLSELTSEAAVSIADGIGLSTSRQLHDEMARALANEDCWLGTMDGVQTTDDLVARLSRRIDAYHSFLQFNSGSLEDEIRDTKTSAGVPVSVTAKMLRSSGVAAEDVNVFVRIDQYEELDGIKVLGQGLGSAFREVINRVIGMRDPHVFYRVGARKHAWKGNLQLYGSNSRLEHQREYEIVDLEDILRRRESRRAYVFTEFAADVTERRLKHAGYSIPASGALLLRHLFPAETPRERGRRLLKRSAAATWHRGVGVDDRWPNTWKEFLGEVVVDDPLEARLAAAWLTQWTQRHPGSRVPSVPTQKQAMGWTREYWRKERIHHALMQLAAHTGQRMLWGGHRDIESLSGGNILVYASIAKHVWAAWLRTAEHSTQPQQAECPQFDEVSQTIGIEEASAAWFRKIAEHRRGSVSQRFIHIFASLAVDRMLGDDALSYPGHNGFSIPEDDLTENPQLQAFLNEASDVGDLLELDHTTKERDRRRRRKFYPQPILTPYLRLPAVRVKEPLYVKGTQLVEWFEVARQGRGRVASERNSDSADHRQLPLL